MDATQLIVSTLEGIRRDVADSRAATSEHFRRVYEKIDTTNHEVSAVGHEVTTLAGRVARLEATTEAQGVSIGEFLTYRDRARVAGSLGKGLWVVGGWLLAAAAGLATAYHSAVAWLTGR